MGPNEDLLVTRVTLRTQPLETVFDQTRLPFETRPPMVVGPVLKQKYILRRSKGKRKKGSLQRGTDEDGEDG